MMHNTKYPPQMPVLTGGSLGKGEMITSILKFEAGKVGPVPTLR